MNLVLHGVGAEDTRVVPVPVQVRDALSGKHGEYEVILANPPFGKKSSVTITADDDEVSRETLTLHREDFWATTSNKQLNFVQHIFSSLKMRRHAHCSTPTCVSSCARTEPKTGSAAPPLSAKPTRRAAGSATQWMNCLHATRPASISSG